MSEALHDARGASALSAPVIPRCALCPRMCRARREADAGGGRCGMGESAVVSRAAPHLWEEPCLSGTRGSGAVFFAGCGLGCVYCQNYAISHENAGRKLSDGELADVMRGLEARGAHNISFITGTHFIPAILRALKIYRPRVPLVWNSGGYERVETLRALDGVIDIYLPDLKHVSPRIGQTLAQAPDYFAFASKAIIEMQRQTGEAEYDGNGLMRRGVIVRHLVLPGCVGDSLRALDWIAGALMPGTPVSIMRQYTPIPQCAVRGMERAVTDAEYERVLDRARALSLNALTQESAAAQEAFIPDFDMR